MPHILVICTANICRSPVVYGLLQQQLSDRQMGGWTVSSAGTWTENGHKASRHSVDLLAEQGIDLTDHRSEMVTAAAMAAADLVLCMESGHAEALRVEFPQQADRVFLLSEMVGKHFSVADPYGRSQDAYKLMIREVSGLIDNGWSRIVELAERNAAKRG
jgi:protein-tyrosine phosphatase